MAQRSLSAVLAGINEYQPPVKPLHGCMYDIDEWERYLKGETEFKLDLQVLRNAEVTKSALTEAIRSSLSKAGPGDIVFLFYSGHGTRESADPVFAELEQDNALESLVCHDSIKYSNGAFNYDLLSDKEIHYLISAYGKDDAHILTVFDCCHSGGITRNMLLGEKDGDILERRYIPTERMSFIAPMRKWENFIFAEKISREKVEEEGWMRVVPQRRHLTLSACQNDESAFEQNAKGIFTANMIDVLHRSQGALSYYDLQSRVRLFTQNQFRQTPEIYAVRGHENDVLRTFLDKPVVHKNFGCTCYLKKNAGWVIDLGAIHGISAISGPVEIVNGNIKYESDIDRVFPHYSTLTLSPGIIAELKPEEAYRASVKSHFAGNTTFYPDIQDDSRGIVAQISTEAASYLAQHKSPFALADSLAHAGYLIRSTDQAIWICHNDDAKRPVTEISITDADVSKKALQYMRHIGQWEYMRTLCNPDFITDVYPVELAIYRLLPDSSKTEIALKGDTLEFDYDNDATGKMKVRITNTSAVKYYCAILYLSNEFRIYGDMLDGKVVGLNANESAWVYNGDAIELDLEQHVMDFNYPYSTFYLKLLANPEPFQVDTLEQSALPAPIARNKRGKEAIADRGMKTREEKAIQEAKWFTRTLCFKGRNPFYKERQ